MRPSPESTAWNPSPLPDPSPTNAPTTTTCDYCGSVRLEWRKCKLVCSDCKQINKSCADL